MTISIPSFISPVPSEELKFDANSIIIEDDGCEYLIGEAAGQESLKSQRQVGGSLKRPQYKRLLKGLVASILGEGKHKVTPSLSASLQWIDLFREGVGQSLLSEENKKLLKEAISEIKFKTGSNLSPLKLCQVEFDEKAFIFSEIQAVASAIPPQLKTYVLWQLGHGDLQQVVIIDGKPQTSTLAQAEGIAGAINKFAALTKLSESEALKAWHSNTIPEKNGMNGVRIDATKYKTMAINQYYNEVFASLINKNEKYKERATNIVLSGGGAKDNMFVDILKREVEADGIYKLYKINELPVKDLRCDDPSFTCVNGLLSIVQNTGSKILALDVGNSYLKGDCQ
jgi:hypothetical protein